jgi:GMP synthase-like glutamine amidotransferase
MLAHALGGVVEEAPSGGEVGWYGIETDVPELIPAGPYLQWHTDRVVLPPTAVELARSPVGPQAFRLGSALAVQFHPETTPDVAARWAADGRQQLASLGLDETDLTASSVAEAERARARAAVIVEGFLAGP